MWVRFYRNDLPLFGDHTTNRIERQFWSFKESLADRFAKTPKTGDAIIHLLKFINERLEERKIAHDNKRLVIFDADTTIHNLNKEASQILNEKGCILFHKALSLLRERRNNLSFSDEGVTKTFFLCITKKEVKATKIQKLGYRAPSHTHKLRKKDL